MGMIYDKTVKDIIREYVENELEDGGSFSTRDILTWFNNNYPRIKEGTIRAHLALLSVNAKSRIHYNLHSDGSDDILFQIDRGNYRKFDPSENYKPIYKNEDIDTDVEDIEDIEEEDKVTFSYEKDLQFFLSQNLNKIEDGLSLFEDGDVNGIEYPVGGRFVDILAVDRNNNLVVIELKASRGHEKVIGQLLRYMAWLKKNQAEENQKVRGMIVCNKLSTDLKLACSIVPDISLYEYDLSVTLRRIN